MTTACHNSATAGRVPTTKPKAIAALLDDRALLRWLHQNDSIVLEDLWNWADAVRERWVGPAVHLRGLIEISNICVRACTYCGISTHNHGLTRYRMTVDEIVACAVRAKELEFGTVVLQAGEDPGLDQELIAEVITRIKAETGLAVTLSLGERCEEELVRWRKAGADRYLIRFETSNPDLYRRIHPARARREPVDRIAYLERLQELGYQAGSGVMVGIPGQTWTDLIQDLRTFQALDLDMIGIGPWLPHPATPLANDLDGCAAPNDQVPNDRLTTLKMVALTRLLVPDANLPATSALATIDKATGRELGLAAGGNVVMPDLTPPAYRALYEIYPNKACVEETAEDCQSCLTRRIEGLGREVGVGPGAAPKLRLSEPPPRPTF